MLCSLLHAEKGGAGASGCFASDGGAAVSGSGRRTTSARGDPGRLFETLPAGRFEPRKAFLAEPSFAGDMVATTVRARLLGPSAFRRRNVGRASGITGAPETGPCSGLLRRAAVFDMVVLGLDRRNRIDARQPAIEIDVGATAAAERAKAFNCGLAADRTGFAGREAGAGHETNLGFAAACINRRRHGRTRGRTRGRARA